MSHQTQTEEEVILITTYVSHTMMIMIIMIMNLYSVKTIEEYSKALYIKLELMNK